MFFCLFLASSLAAAVAVGLLVHWASSQSPAPAVPARPPPVTNKLLFGIPAATRHGQVSAYLLPTVYALLARRQTVDLAVLVYVVDDDALGQQTEQLLAQRFAANLADGSLTVVTPRRLLAMLGDADSDGDARERLRYPLAVLRPGVERCRLRRQHNDTLLRVLWRSKLTVDAAHLLIAAAHLANASRCGFYVHAEDDTPLLDLPALRRLPAQLRRHAADMAYARLYTAADEPVVASPSPGLHLAERGLHNGFFGVALLVDDLLPLADHLLYHFDRDPIDWNFASYFHLSSRATYQFQPSLFAHLGTVSTRPSDVDVEPPDCHANHTQTIVCWRQCE